MSCIFRLSTACSVLNRGLVESYLPPLTKLAEICSNIETMINVMLNQFRSALEESMVVVRMMHSGKERSCDQDIKELLMITQINNEKIWIIKEYILKYILVGSYWIMRQLFGMSAV